MILNFLNPLIDFIYRYLLIFKLVSLFTSVSCLSLIVYFNLKLNLTGEKIEHWIDVINSERISERRSLRAWRQIQKRLKIASPTNLKLAVLEADRILGEILKLSGYPGDNLDERLESITPAQIPNIEELRQVHKIRNRIVSEPDFSLAPGETKIAVDIYRRTFIDLGLISEGD